MYYKFKENIKEFYNDWKLYNLVKYFKIFIVVLFIIVEEIAWNKIGRPAYIKVKSLKIMTRFKNWIGDVENRWKLLAIFLTPFILMEVSSLFAVKALATGAIITGIGLYTIKILLTAPVVIIFNAAKPELVSFYPIRWSYGAILNFKRSKTFRGVKTYMAKIKDELTIFKNEYLDGDAELGAELKKMYEDIKKV